jgi:hypothetical protein
MIDIIMNKKKNSSGYVGFSVTGHAGWDEDGKDIVCASISVLSFTAVGGLINMTDSCEYSFEKGRMFCSLTESISQSQQKVADIILETIHIGFKQVEKKYFENVRVSYKEV